MTQNETMLLINLAAVQVADLAERRKAMRADDTNRVIYRILIHKLLLMMTKVCDEHGMEHVFDEATMERMLA